MGDISILKLFGRRWKFDWRLDVTLSLLLSHIVADPGLLFQVLFVDATEDASQVSVLAAQTVNAKPYRRRQV